MEKQLILGPGGAWDGKLFHFKQPGDLRFYGCVRIMCFNSSGFSGKIS